MAKANVMMLSMFSLLAISYTSAQVLVSFENYECDPYPTNQYNMQDAYDDDVKSGHPVPSTKVDALIHDIYQRITTDLEINVKPSMVTVEMIDQAINIYTTTEWDNIAGYFPWRLSHFIRDLNQEDKTLLIQEISQYMAENGVYGYSEEEYEK